uniref:Uncharacterized protein n=1 Tax=Timema cristinae TaxID=61476 RepID=A0A7R9GVG5_TIMCR|nr:unnamed protein product [Timema cristinae]
MESQTAEDGEIENNPTYVYCPLCNKAWPGWDMNVYKAHPDHVGSSIEFQGVFIQLDFLTPLEEEILMKGIDSISWDLSQSGRRKQNYGPKCNFKKKRLAPGDFKGFPEFSKFVQDKFKNVDILENYQTIEQCSLEYDPSRGASIDPHIDDCWVWGKKAKRKNKEKVDEGSAETRGGGSQSVKLSKTKYIGLSEQEVLCSWETLLDTRQDIHHTVEIDVVKFDSVDIRGFPCTPRPVDKTQRSLTIHIQHPATNFNKEVTSWKKDTLMAKGFIQRVQRCELLKKSISQQRNQEHRSNMLPPRYVCWFCVMELFSSSGDDQLPVCPSVGYDFLPPNITGTINPPCHGSLVSVPPAHRCIPHCRVRQQSWVHLCQDIYKEIGSTSMVFVSVKSMIEGENGSESDSLSCINIFGDDSSNLHEPDYGDLSESDCEVPIGLNHGGNNDVLSNEFAHEIDEPSPSSISINEPGDLVQESSSGVPNPMPDGAMVPAEPFAPAHHFFDYR